MIDFKFDVNGLLEQLKPAAESVAKTLGTSSDKLLEVGVRGMIAEGIYASIISIMSIIAAAVSVFFIRWGVAHLRRDEDIGIIEIILGGLGFAVSLMVLSVSLHYAVISTIAPQYALLLKISELLK